MCTIIIHIMYIIVLLLLIVVIIIWVGCVGSNCTFLWEGSCFPWRGCADSDSKCELWNMWCSICLKGLVFWCWVFVFILKPLPEETGAEDSAAAFRARSQGGWYKKKCCTFSHQICWSLPGAWLTGLHYWVVCVE